jgi:hypothetical protein
VFVGVSVFGELNGHRRWDFSERGRLLTSTPPLEVSLLDQSVNQAFSRETRLIVLVREPIRNGILAWVGLYRYVREPRGGKGAQGAGIWLRDAKSAGHATLSFLDSLADTLPTLDLAHWADKPDWSVAVWLSEVQATARFSRFKRIFLSEDAAVSRQLRTRVNSFYPASTDCASPAVRGRLRPRVGARGSPGRPAGSDPRRARPASRPVQRGLHGDKKTRRSQ